MPFMSLHTADPAGGNQTTHEVSYTGYRRMACNDPRSKRIPATEFPKCSDAEFTLTHFVIGEDETGAGQILVVGVLPRPLLISSKRWPMSPLVLDVEMT